jgi:hypothetical protein
MAAGLRREFPRARRVYIEPEWEWGTLSAAHFDVSGHTVVWLNEVCDQYDPLWRIYHDACEAGRIESPGSEDAPSPDPHTEPRTLHDRPAARGRHRRPIQPRRIAPRSDVVTRLQSRFHNQCAPVSSSVERRGNGVRAVRCLRPRNTLLFATRSVGSGTCLVVSV